MKHDDFAGYLSRYLAGELPEHEKDLFELHAADCPQCNRTIHAAIDERELIDRYVTNKLSPGEQEFLERHYFTCSACLEAVQQTRWLAEGVRLAALQSSLAPAPSLLERLKAKLSSFQPLSLSPAFVLALLLLLMIYPAWQGLVELPQVKRELSRLQRPQANGQVYMLLTMRGAQEAGQIITIPRADDAVTPLVLQFTLPGKMAEDSHYRGTIEEESSGKIIWEEDDLRSSGEYEVYAITCPSSFFKPGNCLLRIKEVSPEGAEVLQEFSFAFEIVIAQ